MKRTKHGFTLVELIIVIAVIGVLAAILIPTFSNVIDKANAKSALSDARNTVTQYLTDSFDKGLPENLVVVIKKANNYYLYGYNTTGEGIIQVSSGNPYKGLNSVEDLINEHSWNAKQGEDAPDTNVEYTEADTFGTFYLVPYTGTTPNVAIKGFHAGKADVDMAKYPNLKHRMTENMGDNTDVFHGILLPGQFTLDTGANGSGTGNGNTPDTPEIPETPKYTVTFDKGSLASDENAVVPAPQELSTFIPANWASQCTYTHAEDADEWYIFDHFEKDGTKIESATPITEATTVTVVWKHMEATKYTLTFDMGTGDSMDLNGFTNGSEVRGDVASIITSATAAKAHANFTGWKLDDEHVYTSDYEGAININANWTLTAQFDDIKHTVTYKSGDGTGADIEEKLTDGSTVNLKTFASTGFTAPDGKVFYRWVVNTVEYADGATLPDTISSDITVTAKYRENKFTVEYEKDRTGISSVPEKKTYNVGTESVALNATASDYYYIQRYDTTAGTVSGNNLNTSGITAGTEIVITPVTQPKTITFTYTKGGDAYAAATVPTGIANADMVTYKDGYTIDSLEPTCEGYTFTGYDTTVAYDDEVIIADYCQPGDNFAVSDYKDATKSVTVTFTACWEAKPIPTPDPGPTEEPIPEGWIPIRTKEDFMSIGKDANYPLSGKYYVTNDIDFSGEELSAVGFDRVEYDYWYGDQVYGDPFTGEFNGNGYAFTNVAFVERTYNGLFHENQGKIYDLYVKDLDTVAGGSFGTIAMKNIGTISRCGVTGAISIPGGYWYNGGIAGFNGGTIDQCWTKVNMTTTSTSAYYYGGIAGQLFEGGTISNCFAFGTVQGAKSAGIAGEVDGTVTIQNCYSMCNLVAPDTFTKHIWGNSNQNVGTTFKDSTGLFFQKGLRQETQNPDRWESGYNDPNHKYAYGCGLNSGQWTQERLTGAGWSDEIWDFSGDWPTLINAPVFEDVAVEPPVTPRY